MNVGRQAESRNSHVLVFSILYFLFCIYSKIFNIVISANIQQSLEKSSLSLSLSDTHL